VARNRYIPWIERNNYDAVKRMIADDSMPNTLEEWIDKTLKQINEWLAAGIVVEKVVVNPDQFTAWCLASGVDHNLATLGAFTVAIARKQREHGT
jgi:hypothetical protein